MVRSVLDSSIIYPETAAIDGADFGYDASQFEIEVFPDLDAIVALGNVRYTFADKNVLYVPVYLIKGSTALDQIGVYEFLANDYPELLDADNDIDITLMPNPLPLYYSFFTPTFLKSKLGRSARRSPVKTPVDIVDIKKKDDGDDVAIVPFKEELVESGKWSSPNSPRVITEILEEEDTATSKEDMSIRMMNDEMKERSRYKSNKTDSWIKQFMKNGSYSLLDNEGKGDCLFAVIRDAFKGTTGDDITVAKLRDILSKAADEKVFQDFQEQYEMYANEIKKITARQLKIKDDSKVLRTRFATAISRDDKKKIAAEATVLQNEFAQLKKEKNYARELQEDYAWMAGIDSLNKFKDKIKQCSFWAETWSINTLERILNIKLVILSAANYSIKDFGNVLLCGDMIDKSIATKGSFEPKHYIITAYTGRHYMLVRYNDKRIFTFETLPFGIKRLVLDRCMERDTGIYNLIPQFKKLRQTRGIIRPAKEEKELPKTDEGVEDIGFPTKEEIDEGLKSMKGVKFDDSIVFQFYSRSRNSKPGKGAGEKIDKSKILGFAELAGIPDWRRILSNFYVGEFNLDGKRWLSVENFYHGSKFKKNNPDFYALFSLDSGSEISKNPALAKAAGGATGKYKGKRIRSKDIKIDPDFFTSNENERAMYRAQMAKYKTGGLAKRVLLATKDAKLQHFVRGSKPIVFYDTMAIRERLRR